MTKVNKILVLFAASTAAVLAQTAAQATAFQPAQFFSNNGVPLAGGFLLTYQAGTSTPQATCHDSACLSMNPTTITLDAAGRAAVFLPAGQGFKFVLEASDTTVVWTEDNVSAANESSSLPLSGGTVAGNLTVTGLATFNNATFTGSCSGGPCLWTNTGNTVYLANSSQTVSPLVVQNQALSGDTTMTIQASSAQAGSLLKVNNNAGTLQASISNTFDFTGDGFIGNTAAFSLGTANGLQLANNTGVSWSSTTSYSGTGVTGIVRGFSNALEVNNGTPVGSGGSYNGILGSYATMTGVFQSTVAPGISNIAFQINSSGLGQTPFQVDGNGDINSGGQINLAAPGGVTTVPANAYKMGNVTVIDNSRNGFFNNLTVSGTCTGCGGGGGGGGLPVSDTTIITQNASDPTKQMRFSNSAIPTGNTVVLTVPPANSTLVSEENTETISGQKTFTALLTDTSGIRTPAFASNAAATASGPGAHIFQLDNSNLFVDSNGSITTSCASLCTVGVSGAASAMIGGYLSVGLWVGLPPNAGTPSIAPGGGYSALTYKGGTSGLVYWVYDAVHSAWTQVDFASVAAAGITSINGQLGPAITVNGTTNGVTVGTAGNVLTLNTPQPIGTGSDVVFKSLTAGCGSPGGTQYVIQSCAPSGTGIAFQINNLGFGTTPFQVNGRGDIGTAGGLFLNGSGTVLSVGATPVLDSSRNLTVNSCTGCGAIPSGAWTTYTTSTTPTLVVNNITCCVIDNNAYQMLGNTVFIRYGIEGTSNGLAPTFSVPFNGITGAYMPLACTLQDVTAGTYETCLGTLLNNTVTITTHNGMAPTNGDTIYIIVMGAYQRN